jgi:CubicO group peptidase (beta-lactamase class C family)
MAIAPARLPLPSADPSEFGLDPERMQRLYAFIESQIADNHYPGATVAFARHGKLLDSRSFGAARVDPVRQPATDDTLWLLYSQTKIVLGCTIWALVDQGALGFTDKIGAHVPEFAKNSKGDITLIQVLTHQGGYPNAKVSTDAWADHELLRREVCDFELEWWPGSRVHYHGLSAHWTAAVLIEAVTGRDFRDVVRSEVLDPLGLSDILVGVPDERQHRCSDMHVLKDGRQQPLRVAPESDLLDWSNSAEWRAAGVPGGGGYATAASMAALYQMIIQKGEFNGVRVISPRVVEYATRNHTGDRVDDGMGMPMHRGIGPHVRGVTATIRGLGTIAHPGTFGHGGAGSSYSWGDPESGLSFSYISNCKSDDPWHSWRLDRVSNLAHACLVDTR